MTGSTEQTGNSRFAGLTDLDDSEGLAGSAGSAGITGNLYFHVLIALLVGAYIGHFHSSTGAALKPVADGFLALVKMLVSPLVFCTVVLGILGLGDPKKEGRTFADPLFNFEQVAAIALCAGPFALLMLLQDTGLSTDPRTTNQGIVDFVLHIIPRTFTDAFTGSGGLIQVLFLAILFGYALKRLGHSGRAVHAFIADASGIFFAMLAAILKLAPIGAGAAMALLIFKLGAGSVH